MWLIQLQMQNAPADKTHELKTNVISIQLWIFAALPVDAPHLCWKTRVANMYDRLVRWRNYSTVLCLSEFMSIDQISAGLPPKPQTIKKKQKQKNHRWFRAIRLECEQAVGDSFRLNRESGVSYQFLLLYSGVVLQGESSQLKLFSCTFNSETTRRLQ